MREKPNRFSIQVGANTLGGSGATGQPPAAGITATGSGVPAILAAAAAGLDQWQIHGEPQKSAPEQVFFTELAARDDGSTETLLKHARD